MKNTMLIMYVFITYLLTLTSYNTSALECSQINTIDVQDELELYKINEVVKLYQGECFNLKILNMLTKDITNILINQGFITSKPSLVSGSTKTGAVKIKILYSKIDKITIKENTLKSDHWQNALAVNEGMILNTYHLDESVDNISRLYKFNTNVEIFPSQSIDHSDIEININYPKKWGGYISYDNSGENNNGANLVNVNVYYSDLLGMHESWIISTRQGFNTDMKKISSNQIGFTFTIPYEHWLLTLSTNYFKYDRKIVTPKIEGVRYNGLSFNNSIELERVIFRNGYGKTSAGVLVSSKDSSNYIETTLINTNSKKVTTGTLKFTQMVKLYRGWINGILRYTKSLKKIKNLYNFDYWNIDLLFSQPFSLKEHNFALDISASTQFSNKRLIDTEEFSIGGLHSVRGFRDNSLRGEAGYFLRSEVKYFLDTSLKIEHLKNLYLYTGYDFGRITKNIMQPFKKRRLDGMAFGIKGQINFTELQIGFEKALNKGGLPNKEKLIFIKLGLKF